MKKNYLNSRIPTQQSCEFIANVAKLARILVIVMKIVMRTPRLSGGACYRFFGEAEKAWKPQFP